MFARIRSASTQRKENEIQAQAESCSNGSDWKATVLLRLWQTDATAGPEKRPTSSACIDQQLELELWTNTTTSILDRAGVSPAFVYGSTLFITQSMRIVILISAEEIAPHRRLFVEL